MFLTCLDRKKERMMKTSAMITKVKRMKVMVTAMKKMRLKIPWSMEMSNS